MKSGLEQFISEVSAWIPDESGQIDKSRVIEVARAYLNGLQDKGETK